MNLLTIKEMKKAYTDRVLFDNADFSIGEGEKVGVIGVNGTGKSTLLKVAAGFESLDGGEVIKANKVKVNYLSQNPQLPSGMTVYDYVITSNAQGDNKWELEGEAKTILTKLGFTDYSVSADNLSGGQKKRAALAATLLSSCEILILDEPTNHMDDEMVSWLEDYLKKRKEALIMVTHDRYFLDRVVNRIVEIDNGKIYSYKGKYSDFLEQKTLREEIGQANERKRQSILRVELEWLMRGARARSTKQKAHIQRVEALRDEDAPAAEEGIKMDSVSRRLGKKTIEVNGLSKAYGDRFLIKDFTYIFLNGDRVGIVGKNGCGKSTLMKLIMGEVEADAGSIEKGSTVKIGYFSQENEYLPENIRVLDYIKDTAEYVKTVSGVVSASQMLTRFLFNDTLQYQAINRLSGGEKRRLYLLKVLMEAPNVLILDEPTNDLDIQTMAVFEEYLDSFDGIVMAVSHDRYFLNKMAERIFAFTEEGEIKQYEGNYDDYRAAVKDAVNENTNGTKSSITKDMQKPDRDRRRTGTDKLKMTYKEKREFETIEEEIGVLEGKIEKLEEEILRAATDFVKLAEYMKEKERLQLELDAKMDRWMYLTELDDRIKKGVEAN